METSIEIPTQNCSLNIQNEPLVNLTSKNATLIIFGSNILLDENIILIGFNDIQFINLTIDTRMNSINSDSKLSFNNITFSKNCNYSSPKIELFNSSLVQAVFKNRYLFESILDIKNFIIEDCSFFNSALTNESISLINILFEGVHFVNSTLGKIEIVDKITLQNSFIASSLFLESIVIQDVFIYNTYIILSKLFITPASIYLTAINVSLSQSLLFEMNNDNQVRLKNINIQNLESDSQIININSPYINLTDIQLQQVSSLFVLQLNCSESYIKNLTLKNLYGNFLYSNHSNELKLLINLFEFTQLQSIQLFDFKGTIQLKAGKFTNSNCSLLVSQTLLEARIDSIIFSNLSNQVILSLGDLNSLTLQNIQLNGCSQIYFAYLYTIITANFHNITLSNCEECVFVNLNNTLTFMKDINIIDVKIFRNILFQSIDSTIFIRRMNLSNIESNANSIIDLKNGEIVELNSVTIQNVQCAYCLGIISISIFHSVKLNKSTILNSNSLNGSINIQDVTNFTANNNIFQNISSDIGGCFYIKNSSIKIFENYFDSTYAYLGGIIFFKQYYNTTFYIDNNTIINSKAYQGNQVYLQTMTIMQEKQDYFINGPVFIEMFNQTFSLDNIIKKQFQISNNQFKSGQEIYFNFTILDSNKQRHCNLEQDIYINNHSYTFDKFRCQYVISFINFQQKPQNEQLTLKIILPFLILYEKSFNFVFTLNFIGCEVGEQWIRNTCEVCQYGTYSLQQEAPCLQCIAQASECPGGAKIKVKEGYWRPHNQTDLIEKCTSKKSNCLGGEENFTCGEGYIGALCQDCDYYSIKWEQTYSRDLTSNCSTCDYTILEQIKVLIAFIWILCALHFSVSGALRMAKAQLIGYYLRKIGLFFGTRSSLKIDQTEVLVKMVSTYFQLLSILLVLNMQLPQPFHLLSQFIGNPLQTLGLQIECFLLKQSLQIQIVYLKQIWNLISSFIIISFFLFLFLIQSLCKNLEYAILTIFINSLIQLYFYFQGDLIEGMFETLFCIEASQSNYIQASTQYLCYTKEHQIYIRALIIPTLIIIGIFVPTFYCVKLYRNRLKLWTCRIRLSYGYLFMEYKNQFYYWEFIRFFVKSIFYVLSTILIQDFKLLFLFVILVLLIYLELLNINKPYLEQKFNNLDKISTQLELLSLILAYIQYEQQNIVIVYLANILISLFNLIFIIYFVYKIFIELSLEYIKKCQEYLIILLNRFPFLEKCFKKPIPSTMPNRINYLWKKARLHVFKFISQLGNQTNADILSIATTAKGRSVSTISQEPKLLQTLKPSLVRFLQNQSSNQHKEDIQLPSLQDIPVSKSNQSISINQSQILEKSEINNSFIKSDSGRQYPHNSNQLNEDKAKQPTQLQNNVIIPNLLQKTNDNQPHQITTKVFKIKRI